MVRIICSLKTRMKDYSCTGKCTNNISKRISVCRFDDIEKYFGLFRNVPFLKTCTNRYVNGIKCGHLKPQPFLMFTFTSKDDYHIDFFDIISFESILKHKHVTIVLPIYCNIMGEKHVMLFILDKIKHTISILDTNCEHTYSTLFENVVKSVACKYNKKYKIRRIIYPEMVKNIYFKSSNAHGICVNIVMFIAHNLITSKLSVQTILNQINKLTNVEWFKMLNNHSLFYYSVISAI